MALRAPRAVMKRILIGFLSRDEKKNSHWFPERLCNMVQLAGPSVINFDKLLFEFITQNKQFKVNKTSFLRHI